MKNFVNFFALRSFLSLLLCLAIGVLLTACEDDDNGPDSESVEDIPPVANNGEIQATINGSAFNTSLIGAALGRYSENDELDVFYILGAIINNGDTTSISVLFYGEFDDVVENTNYNTSFDVYSQNVTGTYLNIKQSSDTKELGTGLATLRFSQLDRSSKVISGTFNFNGSLVNVNTGQIGGSVIVSASFTGVNYQEFNL